MAKTILKTVDDCIGSQAADTQDVLERVRAAIRRALPEVEEVISYSMPTYKLHGDKALCLASWKRHYSLYAATAKVVVAFERELAPYKVIKGTIRFPLDQSVPVSLIERIAKFRANEIAQRKKTEPAKTLRRD